jgi:hypothetical protein
VVLSYRGTGHTPYEAIAQAVQLFLDSAHAYPSARPFASRSSFADALPP